MKEKIIILLFVSLLLVGCKLRLKESNSNSSSGKYSDYGYDSNYVETYNENKDRSDFVEALSSYVESVMRNKINSSVDFVFYDTNTLLLIPVGHDSSKSCLVLGSDKKSPYSNSWNYLYVGVTYDGYGYNYYIIGEDGKGNGTKLISNSTLINSDPKDIIYTSSKKNQDAYSILYKKYNSVEGNTIYERNGQGSGDFSTLTSIFGNIKEDYSKIVLAGAQDCSYVS